MNNIKLFIDPDFNDKFNTNGYIILKAVLKDEIEIIKTIYKTTIANKKKSGLYESTGANSETENSYINEQIRITLLPFVKKTFANFTFYGGAFLVKSIVNSTELSLHQDWSFVNEETDSALFFWMPLQNVSKENGTIYLIEKSHLFFDIYRSGAYPSNKISRYLIPKKHIKTIEIDTGDLLIYSPALFHGSYKNISNQERIVATALLTNKDASFQYIHKKNKDIAEVYSITSASYLNDINYLSTGKIPPGSTLIKKMNYTNVPITTLMLLKKIYR